MLFHLVLFRNEILNSSSLCQSSLLGLTCKLALCNAAVHIYKMFVFDCCSLSIIAAVTEEERVHLRLETGCPCQPGNSYLRYQMPDLPQPHAAVANRAITHITMCLNWRAFFLYCTTRYMAQPAATSQRRRWKQRQNKYGAV